MESTSTSLLDRLRLAPDADSWGRFVRLYTPILFGWARSACQNDADAADLVQDVFTTVVQRLPKFRPQPGGSFRGWLRTILLNRWRAQLRKRQPAAAGNLDMLPDPADPSFPEATDDQREVLRRALLLLQKEFQPATWEAFRQTALLGRSAATVAAELKISTNAVYVARSRVLQCLRREIAGLLE